MPVLSSRVTLILLLVLVAGCSPPPTPAISPAANPAAAPARSTTSLPGKAAREETPKPHPVDPNAPFPVMSNGMFLNPPYAPPGFAGADATMSGSIHSPLPAGVFFRRPEFQQPEHDGRLYYTRYLDRDQRGTTGTLAFITWRPLDAQQDQAQRVRSIPGYTVEDFETDGKVLLVHHYPVWRQKTPILIQKYRWRGDQRGRGRFSLQQTREGPLPRW